jgi:hypothetical protein
VWTDLTFSLLVSLCLSGPVQNWTLGASRSDSGTE